MIIGRDMEYFLRKYKAQLKVGINLENSKSVRIYIYASSTKFDMYILYIIVSKNMYKYYINIYLYACKINTFL